MKLMVNPLVKNFWTLRNSYLRRSTLGSMVVLFFFPLVSLLSSSAHAQNSGETGSSGTSSSPYRFGSGGACGSQGLWTTNALSQTQAIREAISQLRDSPECTAMGKTINDTLAKVDLDIRAAESAGQSVARMSAIPHELSALRNFIRDSAFDRTSVLRSMMTLANEYTVHVADRLAHSGLAEAQSGRQNSSTGNNDPVASMINRVNQATRRGLENFNGVIGAVSQGERCLTHRQHGVMATAMISMLTAFAGAGQDATGNQLGIAISRLNDHFNQLHFDRAIREINKVEFRNSLSCLLEATSESFCSAIDGIHLFRQITNNVKVTHHNNRVRLELAGTKGIRVENPLYGYYLMAHHIPLITQWLQRIQIGVDPRLETDARFQINIMNEMIGFYTSMKLVQAKLSEEATAIRGLEGQREAQEIKIQELIVDIEQSILRGSRFFTANTRAIEIPFRLLGLNIPQEFFSFNSTITFRTWIQSKANWRTVPFYDRPTELLDFVEKNLFTIIAAAEESVIAYYNTYFIADKDLLFLDVMRGVNYNPRDSLIAIDQYLAHLSKKIEGSTDDQGYITSIVDTRVRIARVLARIESINGLGQELLENLRAGRPVTNAQGERMRETQKQFADFVFDQFQVLLARSGFLSNRVSRFVQYDFQLSLRNQTDMDPYLEDLFYSTGFAAFDRMVTMAGGNPALLKADLDNAMNIGQANLRAIEISTRDYLAGMIREEKMVADSTERAQACIGSIPKTLSASVRADRTEQCRQRHQITPAKNYWNAHVAAFNEGFVRMPGDTTNRAARVTSGLWTSFRGLVLANPVPGLNFLNYMFRWDFGSVSARFDHGSSLQALTNFNDRKLAFSIEDAAGQVAARLCLQALAFEDLRPFWHHCQNLVLRSPFPRPDEEEAARLFDETLSTGFVARFADSRESLSDNGIKRICALRDHYRRNHVMFLTAQQQEIAEANRAQRQQSAPEPSTHQRILFEADSNTPKNRASVPPRPPQSSEAGTPR